MAGPILPASRMGTGIALNAMQIAHHVFAPCGEPWETRPSPRGEETQRFSGLPVRKWVPGTLPATLAARLPA